jgi:diadenosine tetraphosphate (Ap4A) HIT family hydrolase
MIFEKDQPNPKTDAKDEEVKKRRIEFRGKNAEDWNRVCFAIFAKSYRTMGHALLITRLPFDDFTDTINGKDDEKKTTFEAAIWVAQKIKEILRAEKVYITSMCEHWEIHETNDGNTTEHLHFHLVPRYKGMRTKEQAAEKLLCRKERDWNEKDIQRFAEWFNKRLEGINTSPTI